MKLEIITRKKTGKSPHMCKLNYILQQWMSQRNCKGNLKTLWDGWK